MKISAKLDHICDGQISQKHCQNGPDMDAELVGNTLKICILVTTKAILMKPRSSIYLYKIFHLVKNKGITCKATEDVNKKPLMMSQKMAQFLLSFHS